MDIFLGHLHPAQVKHAVQWSFTVFARPGLQKLGWTFHNILTCPRWLPHSPSCNCSSTGFTRAFSRTILGFSFFDLSFVQIRSTLSFNFSNSYCAHIALEMGLRERSSPGDGLGLPSPILAITEFISGSLRWTWAILSVVHENFFSWSWTPPLSTCFIVGLLQKHIQFHHMMGNFHVFVSAREIMHPRQHDCPGWYSTVNL